MSGFRVLMHGSEHAIDIVKLMGDEIVLPLRSLSHGWEVAELLKPIAQKHGLDVMTFDVETL